MKTQTEDRKRGLTGAFAVLMLGLAIVTNTLCLVSAAASDDATGFDLKDYESELAGVLKRPPSCLVDDHGLPQRVIVTRNGAGLFEQPEEGAKRVRSVGLSDRLFLYIDNENGFRRVGVDPYGEGAAGWIPAEFVLDWNTDEVFFLNQLSVPDGVTRVHVWQSAEDAIEGDPEKAIFTENAANAVPNPLDVFFPVLGKDKTGTAFQVGFTFGGDQGNRNEYGRQLTQQERRQVVKNLRVVNVILLLDATESMEPSIDDAKRRAVAMVDALEGETILETLDESAKQIPLTVNFCVIAFRDSGDEFDVKTVVPLTHDREEIKKQLANLEADGGGDEAEMVCPAIRSVLDLKGLEQGALNIVALIGDAPPHEQDEQVLTELGNELESRHFLFYALACGDSALAKSTFESIAAAAGGKVHPLSESESATQEILSEIRTRLTVLPVEEKIVRSTVEEGKSIAEAGRDLGLSDRETRMISQHFLVARGADVASSGLEFRTGWVRIRPGSENRLRLHIYIARWKLAQTLAAMMGITNEISFKPAVAEKARAIVGTVLGLQAGGLSASSGMSTQGQTSAERSANFPQSSLITQRGEQAAVQFNQVNRAKILKLIEYWRNASLWQHEFAFIPVDLLP